MNEGLLHSLDVHGRGLHEGLAVAEIGAEGSDCCDRSKAAPQQADAVQLPNPLAVHDVTLAARHVLYVPRVHEDHLKPTCLEDLVERDPVDARGFHGDGGHAAAQEPVRQTMQVGRERLECTHGSQVALGRDSDVMFRRAAIDARGVRVDSLQERRRAALPLLASAPIVFHRMLLHTAGASGNRDACQKQSPKRDHACACHQ